MVDIFVQNALELLSNFDDIWQGYMLGDVVELGPCAADVEAVFSAMLHQRQAVREGHPWRFGVLLYWLQERVTLVGEIRSRFEIFQNEGCWNDREFGEWVDEVTGVAGKTWSAWIHAVRVYFTTEQGKDIIELAGLSPAEFVETVPMGKAQRAVAKVAAGAMLEHHVDALTDEAVSEQRLRHVLRTTPEQHEIELAAEAVRDMEWVNSQVPRVWIEHSQLDGTIYLKRVDECGEIVTWLVARLSEPVDGMVSQVQQAMIEAAYGIAGSLVELSTVHQMVSAPAKVEVVA